MHLNQKIVNKIAEGEICVFCHKPFYEQHDEPKACDNCGGDGVLKEYVTYDKMHQGY